MAEATNPSRVYISAGEASGDAYAAALIREIARLVPSATFEGVGGAKMRAAGATVYADSGKWGAISITQAAKVFFRVWSGLRHAKSFLSKGPPGLFVPIDFGFANIRMARYAKRYGWRVLYFVPPGSWRRDRQGKDLPAVTDAVVTPFEWSAKIVNEMGAKAHWFGHPIKQLIAESGAEEGARETIAVLPGSREHEIDLNLPLIASAVNGVEYQLEFALAPTVDLEAFKAKWRSLAPKRDDVFTVGDTYGVLKRAKVGIICSGTATLEAAICRCPMVVVYQISKAMRREAKLIGFKRPKFIALPNIIAEKEIVPELAEERGVRPEAVRAVLDSLLYGDEVATKQLKDFDELDALLGPENAITRTAELAVSMMAAKSS